MKIKDFVNENREALISLAEAVREINDIRSIKDEKELFARQYAIEIMDGWLSEIFGITTDDLKPLSQDEDLDNYKRHVE